MLGPDREKIDVLSCSDLNVRHFKFGTQSHTWFRVSCRWPEAELCPLFPFLLYVSVHAGVYMAVAEKHSICKCGESICLPSVPTVPHLVCLWAMFHAGSSQFGATWDEASMQVSSMFSPFYFSFLQVMSCLLEIKLHTYSKRLPVAFCVNSV